MKDKIKTIKFLLKTIKRLKAKYLYYQFLNIILSTILNLISVFILSFVLYILENVNSIKYIFAQICLLFVVVLFVKLITSYVNKKLNIYTEIISQEIILDISKQIISNSFSNIENPNFIDKAAAAITPIDNFKSINLFFTSFPNLIQLFISMSSVIIILLYRKPFLLVIILLVSSIQLLLSQYGLKKEIINSQKIMKYSKEYWYYLRITKDPQIAKDVRIYQMQNFFNKKIHEILNKFSTFGTENYKLKDKRIISGNLFSTSLLIFTYLYILISSTTNMIVASEIMIIVNATVSLFNSINGIQNEVLNVNQQLVYLKEYQDFSSLFTLESETKDLYLNDSIRTIEFKNVSFSYPNSEKNVLKNINLKFVRGKKYSLVGKNGSGKTTLIKLLSGLYFPTNGEILINGININEYEIDSYLKQLSIVFQDFKTFKYSIKENICFENQNEQLLKDVIRKSDLEIEIKKFNKGIHTYIGKNFDIHGVNLSKGQEQKLSIARMLYKEGTLMILDEPTASLDPIIEEKLFNLFEKITNDNLSITISHRLSSCQKSDEIILLNEGRVCEIGTHKELMNSSSLYYEMFTTQASKYV